KQQPSAVWRPPQDQEELIRRAELLQHRFRDLDLRAAQLELSERELAKDRAALEQALADLKARVEETDRELAARKASVEVELQNQRQELSRGLKELETDLPTQPPQPQSLTGNEVQANYLHLRRRELDAWSAYLQRQRRHLREREKDLEWRCGQLA